LQDICVKKPGPHLPGIVKVLVAALEHDSPFCVAAAAAALNRVGDYKRMGQRLIEKTGAISALLDVIKREEKSPSACPTKELFFCRYTRSRMSAGLNVHVVVDL
jgi:hypothetical protein